MAPCEGPFPTPCPWRGPRTVVLTMEVEAVSPQLGAPIFMAKSSSRAPSQPVKEITDRDPAHE